MCVSSAQCWTLLPVRTCRKAISAASRVGKERLRPLPSSVSI
jgi:hypothetical protein